MERALSENIPGAFENFLTTPATGFTRDAFGRVVMTTPTTIFTTDTQFTNQRTIVDYVSTGTGTVFVDVSNSLITLSASGSGGRAIRQSREYLLYQPGKPQLFTFTMVPQYSGTFDNSVAIRAGIFDDYRDKNTPGSTNPGNGFEVNQPSMGHFFELSGNQWFVVERANSSNNIANVNRVPQINWNVDTLNGDRTRSPSGYLLPIDKPIIFFIERQWLGVGAVRMGAYFNGRPVFCHIFQNRGYNRPYTHLSKLPLRWEIEKVSGGSSSTVGMASICGAVHVIGNYSPFGTFFTLPNTISTTSVLIDTNVRPLLAIRLQQQYCRASLKLKSLQILNIDTNATNVGITIYKNPTLAGGSITWVKHPDSRSMIEYFYFPNYNVTAFTVSGGLATRSTYLSRESTSDESLSVDELITSHSYCSDIKGNSDTLVVTGRVTSGTATLLANLTWLELT